MSFPTTRWTLLAEATLHGDAAGRGALATLCEKYRRPVIVYLESRGMTGPEAEDLTQDFFLKLIASRAWKRADQARGRFRTFLLSIVSNQLLHRIRNQHRQKRGGGAAHDSLDQLMEDGQEFVAANEEESAAFDREWALTLVADAVTLISHEFAGRGQAREFELLRRFLPGAAPPPSYEEAAAELGLSLVAMRSAVHRLRERFREVLRTAVARTVGAPHEVDEELRYLGTLLMQGNADHRAGAPPARSQASLATPPEAAGAAPLPPATVGQALRLPDPASPTGEAPAQPFVRDPAQPATTNGKDVRE